MISIYTDGSSRGNPGPGGYCAVMLYGTLRKEGFSDRAYFIIDKSGIVKFKYIMKTPKERLENQQLIEDLKKIE